MTVGAVGLDSARREGTKPLAWWIAPTVPLLAAALAFAWTLHGELQRLYGMTGSAWDYAYDQQVIWNVSVGQGFYSSFARANFLGIHFELILVVLAAVEKFWANPAVLLIFSSAGLAATAPAAYLFFRALLPADRPESPWLAVALSAPIPFWAAIQEAARDFFHPENMALALALLASWAGIRGHRVAMWVLCLLVLTCKEDQVYTVGVIGLLMRVYGAPEIRKHWRFIVYLAGAWFLIGTGIVQQHFRNGGYTDFVYYRWLIGLNPAIHATPTTVLAAIFNPRAMLAVAAIVAGMFAVPVLAPRWLLLAIPPYLANVLSGHDPQNLLYVHYILLLLFPLIVAGGIGARRFLELRSIRPAYALIALIPPLLLAWGTGRFPPMLGAESSLYMRPNVVAQLENATSIIPADAPVSADNGLAVWLANRHTINDFPDFLDASCYVVLQRDAYQQFRNPTDTINPAVRQKAIDGLAGSGRRLLFDDGTFQVWSPVGD
ncbi:MAG: hypothetical protein AUI42_09025 [Actinobacteria bacterium 13_1_40CM_2_65_8]|nr:MAG: hypothetical protein AUH40_08590 [Chloroflexi bacterium 13_1_40CM_65_17]OLD49197.1 MAG: hypothetical protein AUI42_09025 [Actinobacteria bacterium 13_1_40CM_2_65_8]